MLEDGLPESMKFSSIVSVTNFYHLGLKKYGKNWDKIESKIPTRSGTQIRSHAQKFFARIRKEFNTKDPMKYVQKNM